MSSSGYQRWLVSIAVAVLFGALCHLFLRCWRFDVQANDFTYPWIGARALMHGRDPYLAAATGRTPWGTGLLYPIPAVLLAAPVSWMPAHAAAIAFVALSFAMLAFSLSKDGTWRLLLFASGPAVQACISVQWSPLLSAAALTPALLGICVAKPPFGLPVFAFQSRRRAWYLGAAGAGLLLIVSFAVLPSWLAEWLRVLHSTGAAERYVIPMRTIVGPFLAFAVLQWRQPEARLLLGMACMPQLGFFYDQLPLMLIPRTRSELLFAVAASDVAYMFALATRDPRIDVGVSQNTPLVLVGMYGPALYLVLRRRWRADLDAAGIESDRPAQLEQL